MTNTESTRTYTARPAATQVLQSADELSRTMKVTAGCRFIAAKRLEQRDRKLTRLTAFTSAYVIILTVLPYFLKTSTQTTDWINLLTVGCGVVILISSLLQSSTGDIVTAEQHHRSALEINEIRRELGVRRENLSQADVIDLSSRYNQILQKFSVNHDDIDFQKYQIERPEIYGWLTRFDRLKINFSILYGRHVPSLTLLVISLIIIVVLVTNAPPPSRTTEASAAGAQAVK